MGKTRRKPAKQGFLHGAFILLAAIAIVKFLGFLFKVPLNYIIDEVGMSYFSVAYNLYNPIFSLATAGFPIAIARLVSENYTKGNFRDVRRIHTISIPIFATMGFLAFCLMFFGARPYVSFINKTNGDFSALPAIYVLAPAVIFNSLMAIYRGYYEGLSNMYPTALSEIVEAAFKLFLGLAAAYWVVEKGLAEYAVSGTVYGVVQSSAEYAKLAILPYGAGAAILGITVGSLFGFLSLLCYHAIRGDGITKEMLQKAPRPKPMRRIFAVLIRTAVPVALGALAVNLSSLVDSTLIKRRLADLIVLSPDILPQLYQNVLPAAYITGNKVPDFLFGCFTNANTLFMLVPAITQAFGVSALPNVTAAWTSKDNVRIQRSMEAVLRIVAFCTIPAGLGLSVLSGPIASLLGFSSITGRILQVLGISAIFAAVTTPLNSMLQAIGRVDLPVKLLSIGLVIKVVLNYYLVGIPQMNVLGAGIGTLVCYAVLSVCAYALLCRTAHVSFRLWEIAGKPLLSALVCVLSAYLVYGYALRFIPMRSATLLAMVIAVIVYCVCMLWVRALKKSEVLLLPNGQKIVKILENHHWIG